MKAVVVFVLLFAAAYCHPVKRSASSSESAEAQPADTQALKASAVADVSSEEENDDSDSDESDENGTASPPTVIETTIIPIIDGRGDNMGYHSDYKKHVYYVDGNNVEKGASSYKSYSSDKTEYDVVNLKVYKVQNAGLDQGTDASSGTESEDAIQHEPKSASISSASDASPSQESAEESQSSEEATTGATTADSNSSESSESQETNVDNQPGTLKSKNPDVIIA